jgi:hypothetical protein
VIVALVLNEVLMSTPQPVSCLTALRRACIQGSESAVTCSVGVNRQQERTGEVNFDTQEFEEELCMVWLGKLKKKDDNPRPDISGKMRARERIVSLHTSLLHRLSGSHSKLPFSSFLSIPFAVEQ